MNALRKIIIAAAWILTMLTTYPVMAQEQASLRDRAYQFYLAGEYAKAIDLYSRIQDNKELSLKETAALADAYYKINAYGPAEEWFQKLKALHPDQADVALSYAELLKINGKYAAAKTNFLAYKEQFPQGKDVSVAVAGCDSALLWVAHPSAHVIKNEKDVNTSLAEFAVFPLSNGVLYTAQPAVASAKVSGMTGEAYQKIFSASRDDDGVSLKYPVLMDAIYNDAAYHVGPVSSNAAQDLLFVTRTYGGKDTEKVKRDGMRFKKHNLELVIYKKQGDNWVAEAFPHNNVDKYSLGHATLSADEQVLYYVSDMPGGHGGADIWYSEKNSNGSWGTPQNAGSVINGAGDELFPSVFADTLYFSSNSFAGMGGLDIFKAVGQKSTFKARENLKYPINSSTDDFAFIVTADDDERQFGYLSSNRTGGAGSDDIYSFIYTKPRKEVHIKFEAQAFDKATSEAIRDYRIKISDRSGTLLASAVADGLFFDHNLDENTAYKVVVSKEGFMSDSLLINGVKPKNDTTLVARFHLQPVNKKGINFVLPNIYYDYDKADIRPDAAIVLNKLVDVLQENPSLKIELSSHSDSRGAAAYNLKLSERRAQSAVDYIVSRGIAKDRLVSKGYGATKLINRCAKGVKCSEEEHQANRRTEVTVIDY